MHSYLAGIVANEKMWTSSYKVTEDWLKWANIKKP